MRRFSLTGMALIGLALIGSFVFIGVKLIGKSGVPPESTDQVENLSAEALIRRDQNGITYIQAQTENDAMTALGYAHAQDRLWQMELARRAGSGRLAQVFGSVALNYDRFMRTAGIAKVARTIYQQMPAKTRATLQAYTRGINAYIESHQGKFPMEFDALGYAPEPWKPEHSVIVGRMMAWQLNPGLWTDLIYSDILSRVDSAKGRDILPADDPDSPTIIGSGQLPSPQPAARPDTLKPAPAQPHHAAGSTAGNWPPTAEVRGQLRYILGLDQSLGSFLGYDRSGIGSNAWAISGTRTQNALPLLANDPHLRLGAPSQWYQAVIIANGDTLAGVTLPGNPFIVIGRNKDIAWGITSLMGDETDFYAEQLDSVKGKYVLRNGLYVPLTIQRDTILVKDSVPAPIVIRTGPHGPIISDVHPYQTSVDKVTDVPDLRADTGSVLRHYVIAMKWNGNDPSQELAAWQQINSARNFTEFRNAVMLGGCPSLSFVYADRKGNIGYVPGMRVPVRGPACRPNTLNPGWDSRADWTGYVPQNQLPTLYNPPSGYIATANNRLANNLPYHISDLWEDASRSERLRQFLNQGKSFTTLDVGQMQMDVVSPFITTMTGYLLQAFPDSARQGPAVRQALQMLRIWNGAMTPDAPEASIVNEWIQQVLQMTYMDEMGPVVYAEFVTVGSNPVRTLRRHFKDGSAWFDNIRTPNVVESRNDIVRAAFGRALESLQKNFGSWDFKKWRYGAMHTVTFRHAFTSNKALRAVIDIGPFEVGGNSTTLNKCEWNYNAPYQVKVGPSMRQIVDFSDTVAYIRSIIPTGSSGQPLDMFYKNQSTLWQIGALLLVQKIPPPRSETSSVTRLSEK